MRVDAEWDDTGWWVVTIPDVPGAITQCRRLDQVAVEAAEVVAIQTSRPVSPSDLDVQPAVPGDAGSVANEARRLRREASLLTQRVSDTTAEAVHALHRAGFSLRDIGALTGITHQRAQQIVAAGVPHLRSQRAS